MSDRNGDGPHKTAGQLPVGRPFSPGHDERRNAGGRPRGLAAAARAAVGDDGRALIEFFAAVLRADGKALGIRQVPLAARLDAARWLADRGWGRAVTVVELPDERVGPFTAEQAAPLKEMPQELRDGIKRWLVERREEYLAREREAAEAKMRSFLPAQQPHRNGDTPTSSR